MSSISQSLIIFLCVFGAASVTIVGYAIHHFFIGQKLADPEEEFNQRRTEQDQYMAELREKYREGMILDLRAERRADRTEKSGGGARGGYGSGSGYTVESPMS